MKYIKKINEDTNTNIKLETSVNMVISTMKYIDKTFDWTSEFYNQGEFNYGLNYWIHFKGYSMAGTIWRNEFEETINKDSVRNFLYDQEKSIWNIMDEDDIPIEDVHFIITVATNKRSGYELNEIKGVQLTRNTGRREYIKDSQKDSFINSINNTSNDIKKISDHLNKIKTDKVIKMGFGFPNFWVKYDITFDVLKSNVNTLNKINQ